MKMTPIYRLGCCEAIGFVDQDGDYKSGIAQETASGVDVKVLLDYKMLVSVQAFETHSVRGHSGLTETNGQMRLIGTPVDEFNKDLVVGQSYMLKVLLASEIKAPTVAYNKRIRVTEIHWAIAIDDLVTETHVTFEEVPGQN